MDFKFNVTISEEEYFEFNKFVMFKSKAGKKQMLKYRLLLAALFCIVAILTAVREGFSATFLYSIPFLVIALTVLELLLKPLTLLILKSQIKSMKRNGKLAYSPKAELVFLEDCFVETTESNKTEQKYSSVERISIIEGRVIYIHVNNIVAYLLPISAFDSWELYDAFLEFIKTKCEKIDTYSG